MVTVKNVFEMLCFGDCETTDDDNYDKLVEEADEEYRIFRCYFKYDVMPMRSIHIANAKRR